MPTRRVTNLQNRLKRAQLRSQLRSVGRGKKCAKYCRRRSGRGKILDWLKKANKALRSSRSLSKIGNVYGTSGLPGSMYAKSAADVASKLGYGRRRRVGRGIRLAGNGTQRMGY